MTETRDLWFHPPKPLTDADVRAKKRARHVRLTIGSMHGVHGLSNEAGDTCGACAFLVHQGGTAGRYLKCRKARITRGPATDWRAGWRACGLFKRQP